MLPLWILPVTSADICWSTCELSEQSVEETCLFPVYILNNISIFFKLTAPPHCISASYSQTEFVSDNPRMGIVVFVAHSLLCSHREKDHFTDSSGEIDSQSLYLRSSASTLCTLLHVKFLYEMLLKKCKMVLSG